MLVAELQVRGMAKFPFLSAEQELVDFGQVATGLTSEAYIRFGNHSVVPANFRVVPADGFNDAVFTIQPMQ